MGKDTRHARDNTRMISFHEQELCVYAHTLQGFDGQPGF